MAKEVGVSKQTMFKVRYASLPYEVLTDEEMRHVLAVIEQEQPELARTRRQPEPGAALPVEAVRPDADLVLSLDPEDTSEAVVELYSDSQPPPPVDDAAEAAELLAEYFSVVALAEELKSTLNPPPVELYSDSQPRDSQGQWTSGFLGTGRSDGVTDDGLPPTVGPNGSSTLPSMV